MEMIKKINPNIVTKKQLGRKIEEKFEKEDYVGTEKLIRKALQIYPRDHWLIIRLSDVYYERKQYKKALLLAKKAFRIEPECPLILWDYACTLYKIGHNKQALILFKHIVRRGVHSIAFDECGEGLRWARGLITDCYYRIALCYKEAKRKKDAVRYYQQFFKSKRGKIISIYEKSQILKEFREYVK